MDTRTPRGPWWSAPAKQTIDLATALFPQLLYERLDEIGIDFGVVYPSLGLIFMHGDDQAYRRGTCRALNRCNADRFASLSDRLTPVAAIPMVTPEEAIAELEFAVRELGFKAVVLAGYVQRPFGALAGSDPQVANTLSGSTNSASTPLTTTTRCGPRPPNWGCPSPSTPVSSA